MFIFQQLLEEAQAFLQGRASTSISPLLLQRPQSFKVMRPCDGMMPSTVLN